MNTRPGGILHGTVYGSSRDDVTVNAIDVAATYFSVTKDRIRVELDDEHLDELELTAGGHAIVVGFAANFRAEVI